MRCREWRCNVYEVEQSMRSSTPRFCAPSAVLRMPHAPGPYECIVCEYGGAPAPEPWQRVLGFGAIALGWIIVAPMPWFCLRARRVYALYVRQPAAITITCLALIFSMYTPLRGECSFPCL